MSGAADLYEVLQVSPNAGAEVLEAAYRRLARKYHPDAGAEPSVERMAELNGAYETLRDPLKRAAYDRGRSANGPSVRAATIPRGRGSRRPMATAETSPSAAPTAAPAVAVGRVAIACRPCRTAAYRLGKPLGWPRGESFRERSTLRCTECGRHWRYAWTVDHPNVLDPSSEYYSAKAGMVVRRSRHLLAWLAAVVFVLALAVVVAVVLAPDATTGVLGRLERVVLEMLGRLRS
jgi:hypothetical protein